MIVRAVLGAAAAVLLLAGADLAAAIPAPASVTPSPPSPTRADRASFTWSAVAPDPDHTFVRYEGGWAGTNAGASPTDDLGGATSAGPFPLGAGGTYYFKVRAVQAAADGTQTAGPYATGSIVVDRTPPTIRGRLEPARPNGDNGWYTSITIRFDCSDAFGVASCTPPEGIDRDRANADRSLQGPGKHRTGVAIDLAGNRDNVRVGPFDFDALGPPGAQGPSPGRSSAASPALLPGQPTFTWTASRQDGTSGLADVPYELWLDGRRGPRTAATSLAPGQYAQLAEGPTHQWWIRTYDRAGNFTTTGARYLRINSQAGPAPTITTGPLGVTNDTTPTFSWSGLGPEFQWEVLASFSTAPVQSGRGAATSATLAPLPEGEYVFSVSQFSAFGVESLTAERRFEVDTGAPAASGGGSRPPEPPALGPIITRTGASTARLPRRNAARLRPKAGKVLPTRRPVLQWRGGPRGAQLYNVQIFRVVRKRASRTPAVSKVHSVFPRGHQYRVPAKKMVPGACYVWRVWPYLGSRFTAQPLGVSNFCIASRRVLAQVARARAAGRATASAVD
jgi:hypothetical protein